MCEAYNRQYSTNFISVMPTNLYGPNNNFDLEISHALQALIEKFHDSKINNAPQVEIWGTGKPKREFLYVYDLVDARVSLIERYDYKDIGLFVNIGTGEDISIRELAELIKDVMGYKGNLTFNTEKPDDTPSKLLDVGRMEQLGWKANTDLENGIRMTYEWLKGNVRCVHD